MTFILCITYILIGVAIHALYLEYKKKKLTTGTGIFKVPKDVSHVFVQGVGREGGGGGQGAAPQYECIYATDPESDGMNTISEFHCSCDKGSIMECEVHG